MRYLQVGEAGSEVVPADGGRWQIAVTRRPLGERVKSDPWPTFPIAAVTNEMRPESGRSSTSMSQVSVAAALNTRLNVDLREDLQGSGRDQGLSIQDPALLMFLEGLGNPEEDPHHTARSLRSSRAPRPVRNSYPTSAAASGQNQPFGAPATWHKSLKCLGAVGELFRLILSTSPAHAQPMRPAPIILEPACRRRGRVRTASKGTGRDENKKEHARRQHEATFGGLRERNQNVDVGQSRPQANIPYEGSTNSSNPIRSKARAALTRASPSRSCKRAKDVQVVTVDQHQIDQPLGELRTGDAEQHLDVAMLVRQDLEHATKPRAGCLTTSSRDCAHRAPG